MQTQLKQIFRVSFQYDVHFTSKLFDPANRLLNNFFANAPVDVSTKVLVAIDEGVVHHHPALAEAIGRYFDGTQKVSLAAAPLLVTGGEAAKNGTAVVDQVVDAIDRFGVDRHSYVMVIGGGAVLDAVGYAAAIAHRGIRLIRVPTTVLAQNDSGMGVKNGINFRGKKNFIGTFTPPVAVFNDRTFLRSLTDRQWLAGISEAVKVALIKDAGFFDWIEANAVALRERNAGAMDWLIHRCAELHLQHIAGDDPFEFGSSRPLDFGHWSAHKLEQLSAFGVLHGEAVAIGIALDTVYSGLAGLLTHADQARVLDVIQALGLPVFHPLLVGNATGHPLLDGLAEFREHLGGRLTIMLLTAIGSGVEVHALDNELILRAAATLQERAEPTMITYG